MKKEKKRAVCKYILSASILALLFLAITINITNHGQLQNLDKYINQKMPLFQTPFLTIISIVISNLFNLTGLAIIFSALMIFLVYKKRIYNSKILFFGFAGGAIIETVLKLIIQGIRPENAITEAFGFSFPSGHAAMTMILFSMIIILFKDRIKSNSKRLIFILINILIILIVGLSRVYLNVHWFSDVIAGFILGAFWLIITLLIIKK